MSVITDTSGNALTSIPLTLAESSESSVMTVRVPCVAGQFLSAAIDASAKVLARLAGSGGAFVDLAVAPISLTPYAGGTRDFELKVQALAIAGSLVRVALPVRVAYQ